MSVGLDCFSGVTLLVGRAIGVVGARVFKFGWLTLAKDGLHEGVCGEGAVIEVCDVAEVE